MKFYQIAEKRDGVMNYNKEKLASLIEFLYDGRYLISFQRINPLSDIKDYRRCYFAKLDALAQDIGEDRYSMHQHVKDQVISRMANEVPEAFTVPVISTRSLTKEGWSVLLERLDLWAFVEYGTVLQ